MVNVSSGDGSRYTNMQLLECWTYEPLVNIFSGFRNLNNFEKVRNGDEKIYTSEDCDIGCCCPHSLIPIMVTTADTDTELLTLYFCHKL